MKGGYEMQNSAEIRWFWSSPPAKSIELWFRLGGGCTPGGGKEREDVYLIDPGQRELGIKERGGKAGVEVKGMVAQIAHPIKVGTFAARGELWTKWTTEALQLKTCAHVTAYKRRWLRKFAIKEGNVREMKLNEDEKPADPGEQLPDQGCNLEFTEVSLAKGGQRLITMGFESFGPHGLVEAHLRRTIDHLAASANGLEFDGAEELSYPAWLALHFSSAPKAGEA
jgi:hypothetical protein